MAVNVLGRMLRLLPRSLIRVLDAWSARVALQRAEQRRRAWERGA